MRRIEVGFYEKSSIKTSIISKDLYKINQGGLLLNFSLKFSVQ